MLEIRTFQLGNGDSVVVLRGELGAESVAELVAEVARQTGGAVVVDLLRALLVDERALTGFADVDASFVAQRPLLDVLQPITSRTFSTLAAALA